MQSHRQTLIERTCDTILAFCISSGVMYLLLTRGVEADDSFWIVALFTAISFVRGYIARRFFNWWWGGVLRPLSTSKKEASHLR